MAEKRWPQEEKSAHNGHEARPRSLKGRESNERNPETGAAGKKNEKTSDALDTGGGACGYNRRHSEPGAVPGRSIWEIPAFTTFCRNAERRLHPCQNKTNVARSRIRTKPIA